jgi:hypothetical protein
MKWMGFRKAMFEDNYPVKRGDCYSLKKVFSEVGFTDKGKVIIPANKAHSRYTERNIATYTTFPPLFKNELTRWGDAWDMDNYPTSSAIYSDSDADKYSILKEEAYGYTWICYVELNHE